jgi:transcription termination/antitermination protein NusG
MRIGELMSVQESNLLSLPTPSGKLPILAWYIIHTCSRHEVKVESGLTRKGLETFLPKMTVRSRRRDRLQMLEAPLFPGYLFVRTDLNEWAHYHILRTLGVVRILGIKGQCTPVPEDTVTSLRTLVHSGQPILPWPKLRPGQHVRVVEGPLMGASGVILKNKQGKRRLLVAVELLGRSVCAELAEETVEVDE